ncbi:kinesin-like protein KIF20A [Adelges cooleyi]|uniref:kinesin-like protein KIF20A n=1 Tax=Adelges cooleyi TaxID=133065 RepID=UPI0021803CE6|nr:kinesin-like protein KIF20A [Adelges cooleyi]
MDDSKEHHSTGSYVEPRIPSITGFGQRKLIGKPKKVLDYSMERSNDNSGIPKIDVCLRIKPRTVNKLLNDNTLTILSDTTVAVNNGNAREDVTEYTFSSIFGPNVDQKKFFDNWVYDKVLRFLNGNNELLFAYGTTNAGKTFTIHGTHNDPGLIPRTLQLVFSTLNDKLMPTCKYKPDKVIAAHILDENLMEIEENMRKNILTNWAFDKTQCTSVSQNDDVQSMQSLDQLSNINITKMFDVLKSDEKAVLNHGDVLYTVWVTYAEIYNEAIYDLLVSHTINQKRIPLKLSHDQNKNVYVRDLTHIYIKSAEEAYKVMSFGKNNLKIASNNLNKLSSRSHCIFTLKLMRVENVVDPKTAVISSISFCDLAGSERLKKTLNIGDRLKESKNINTSLLVLNKCFSVLRENQKRGENHLVPYRESKLTQMFQTALTGTNKTGISMTVNVDTSPSLLEETKQVLTMSAIVRSIAKTKPKVKPRPSFAVWVTNNRKSLTSAKGENNIINEDEEDNSALEKKSMLYEDFETVLNEEKAKLRKELVGQFQKMLEDNNTFCQKQRENMLKNKTEMYENKIKRLKEFYLDEIRERDDKLANKNGYNRPLIETQELINNKSEMENFEFRIGELELQKEELITEIKTLKNQQQLSQENVKVKNEEIEMYKGMLIEANTEYEKLEVALKDFNDRYDELAQELEDKDLEIERLNGAVFAKDNIIFEMEENQDELVEQKLYPYIEEYVVKTSELNEIIANLKTEIKTLTEENTRLRTKCQKAREDQIAIAKKYQLLRNNYKIVLKNTNMTNFSMDSNISSQVLPDQEGSISKLQETNIELEKKIKEYQNKCQELQSTNEVLSELNLKATKPEMKSIAVLTDISNLHMPLDHVIEREGKENELTQSGFRPQRKCKATKTPVSNKKKRLVNKGTPDMSDKLLDDAINNIPISTRKRKLFDSKPPLTDSSNMTSDHTLDTIPSPARALHQMAKLRQKK